MNVGELFVSLGVKGTDKTVQAFTTVKTGLGDMASMSLEAKAAIIGAVYALEQLMSQSAALGTNLTNTSTLLGVDTKTLQQYGYAASMVGSNLQELEGTFKSLQSQMAKIRLSEGYPKWLGEIARVTKTNIDGAMIENFKKNPNDFFQLLQTYAQREKDAGRRNEILSQFIGSDNLKKGMVGGEFNERVFRQAPIQSAGQLRALDEIRRGWTKLGLEIQNSIGNFNAKYGGQLIKDIREITASVLKLAAAFTELDKNAHILKAIGSLAENLASIINATTLMVQAFGGDKKKEQELRENFGYLLGPPEGDLHDHRPWLSPSPYQPPGGDKTVNQYFYFTGSASPLDLKKAAKDGANSVMNKKVDGAGRNLPGQGQGPR